MGIANELITRGWTQGGAVDQYGHVCLLGALNAAVFGDPLGWECELRSEEQQVAWMHGRDQLMDLVGFNQAVAIWNDTPGRTFDEVLRVAKQADEELGW